MVALCHMVMYCSRMATTSIAELTAQKIAHAITVRGLSRNKVANLAGFSPNTLRRKLAGGEPFNVAEIYRLAQALDVPAAQLLPEDLTRTPATPAA